MPLYQRRFLWAALTLVLMGCKASKPADPGGGPNGIHLNVDVVPLIIPADSSSTATVWVTVLEDGQPVADSTKVSLVATTGKVDPTIYTTDGLAVATYQSAQVTGITSIIAQALGARDTMNITLY